MNIYKDYYGSAPTTYGDNTYCAASDLSNAVADMLVTYCGFTLVKHATSGGSSDSSNYAEISKDGFNIRIYYCDTNGSDVSLSFYYYYTGKTTSLTSFSTPYFKYNLKYQNAFEIKLRVFNCKAGITYFQIGCDTYGIKEMFTIARCTIISTGAEKIILLTGLSSSTCYINGDTSSLTVAVPSGLHDVDGVKQVLSPAGIMAQSSGCRYILKDFYQSESYKYTGSVQIGDRYFYIPGNGSICLECNAPA